MRVYLTKRNVPRARPRISSGKSSDTTSQVTGPNPNEYEATAQHTDTRATEVCVEVRGSFLLRWSNAVERASRLRAMPKEPTRRRDLLPTRSTILSEMSVNTTLIAPTMIVATLPDLTASPSIT
jgi:hypothetical protein